MNAITSFTFSAAPNVAGPTNSNPISASYTGGAPGVPTYAWSVVTPASPATPLTFINPANASSQIVQFANVPAAPPDNSVTYTATIRVTITDSLGNVSTQNQAIQVQKNGPQTPTPPPGP